MKIFRLLALALVFVPAFASATVISLEQAINTGIVSATITGSGNSHYGESIYLEITNKTTKTITINIENGRLLKSDDPSTQDMIVTKMTRLSIAGNKGISKKVYAMCAEKNNGSPSASSNFTLGNMVSKELKEVAYWIEKLGYQNKMGQGGVWVVTDDMPVASIEGGNAVQVEQFRKLVAKIANKPYGSKEVKEVNGTIKYKISEKSVVSIHLLNTKNEPVRTYIEDKEQHAAEYTMSYNIKNFDLQTGYYTMRVLVNGVVRETKRIYVP